MKCALALKRKVTPSCCSFSSESEGGSRASISSGTPQGRVLSVVRFSSSRHFCFRTIMAADLVHCLQELVEANEEAIL